MKKLGIIGLIVLYSIQLYSQAINVITTEMTEPIENALEIFEPGPLPEGDLIRALAYSADGNMLAALYQHSDNVYFYNTETYVLLEVVNVGREPMDITMSNQFAYICCHSSKEVYIIDLTDFFVSNIFEVSDNPCQIETNGSDTIVYIGSVGTGFGSVAAYDPTNGGQIFYTIEPYIRQNANFNSLGRNSVSFTFFTLSPHGNYICVIDSSGYAPALLSSSTGDLVKKFNFGKMKGSGFSETGDTLYIYSAHSLDSMSLYRIKLNDFSVIDSITTTTFFSEAVSQHDLAINADGTKVLAAGDSWGNEYYFFDFNTMSYQLIDIQNMIFNNAEIFTSHNRKFAIYRGIGMAKFIDLETGQIISRTPIGHHVGMANGAMSPTQNKIAFGDGPIYTNPSSPEEKFHVFDIGDPTAVVADTVIVSGIAPEADVTTAAVLSMYGTKIIATNRLSENISIIDFNTGETESILHMEGVSGVKAIPKTDFVIAYGMNTNSIRIIDIENNETLTELFTGKVDDVLITEDGKFAYLIDVIPPSGSYLTKIKLQSDSSEIIQKVPVSHSICRYSLSSTYNLESTIALSPDGSYLLFGSKDEADQQLIQVFDTQIMDVIKSIPFNDDCLYGFAFTGDSKRVCALFSPLTPILYLDGENSFIESEVDLGDNSFSVAYNPVDELFYIPLLTDWLYKVNPLDGEIIEEIATSSENYLQVGISQNGIPLLRGLEHLLYNEVRYQLPGVALNFSFHSQNHFIIPIPGPDKICVFNPTIADVKNHQDAPYNEEVFIFPNPFKYSTSFAYNLSQPSNVHLTIFNHFGQQVDFIKHNQSQGKQQITWDASDHPPGMYYFRLEVGEKVATGKLLLVR